MTTNMWEMSMAAKVSTNEEIYQELCRLLAPFNTAKVTLARATDISGDLKIDSVSVMDFIMEIEDSYDIDIPLNMLSDIRTLDDLAGAVETRIAGA